jgi:hypothetical protein
VVEVGVVGEQSYSYPTVVWLQLYNATKMKLDVEERMRMDERRLEYMATQAIRDHRLR